MGEAAKTLDGVADELLLGDGFSIVDSTKGDGGDMKDVVPDEKIKIEEKEENPEPAEDVKTEDEPKTEENQSEEKEDLSKDDSIDDPAAAVDDKAKVVNGHDSTLHITTEEHLDLDKEKKNDGKLLEENQGDKEESKGVDKRKQGDVWVSNITRHIKATDLKKHFSKYGKVLTAKIVTNGKSFFGYILMETNDIANKCVRSLHGSTLDSRKITVSRQRPDQRRTTASDRSKTAVVKPKTEKKPSEKKSEEKEKKSEKAAEEKKIEIKRDDPLTAAKRSEARLRRELEYCRREVSRLKRFLSDEQRQLRLEQAKNRSLNRDLQDAEAKLREERRKMDRDRETFDKSQRTDRVKLEADRSLIKKELEEVKKLREYLKRKLEEEARPLERRVRASSPFAYSSKRFRESTGPEKGSKYVEERTRTPPSPPKLSSRSKRSPINTFSMDKDRRGGGAGHGSHYGMEREEVGRHGGGSMSLNAKPSAPAAPRNIWPSFHQEVWRMPPSGSTNVPFGSNQSYQNRQDYSNSSSNKPSYGSQQRDFNKRDHYSGGSIRKY